MNYELGVMSYELKIINSFSQQKTHNFLHPPCLPPLPYLPPISIPHPKSQI
jgi:hypothetical protein